MANSKEFSQLKVLETSREHSISSIDNLNLDCLQAIFPHLPFLDLLGLRYQCRSLNNAVCQHLRTCRKLELYLDADRSGEDLEEYIEVYEALELSDADNYHYKDLENDQLPPISISDGLNSHYFENQPHFQSENLIQVNSLEGLTDRKIDSLIHFLTTHMPNLTKLALLIAHKDYFRSVARLISSIPKLKVFFIDVTVLLPGGYDSSIYPAAEIVDAISCLSELETLYYFRNMVGLDVFSHELVGYHLKVHPHRLSSGENFVEIILPRLCVLHSRYLTFPVGMTFDKTEEITMSSTMADCITRNYFPAVKTLLIEDPPEFYSQLDDGRLSFVNVKVLKIANFVSGSHSPFNISSRNIRALNDLPNLEEMHCLWISFDSSDCKLDRVIERNNTIVRVYSKSYPECLMLYRHLEVPIPGISVPPEMMTEYANRCKKYFRRLQLLTTEHPPFAQQF